MLTDVIGWSRPDSAYPCRMEVDSFRMIESHETDYAGYIFTGRNLRALHKVIIKRGVVCRQQSIYIAENSTPSESAGTVTTADRFRVQSP